VVLVCVAVFSAFSANLGRFAGFISGQKVAMKPNMLDGYIADGRHRMQVRLYYEDTDSAAF
jgi:hypothetical protein